MFQSPSLRGSGRFGGPGRPQQAQQGFNPLHCGAVVASTVGTIIRGRVRVEFQSPSLRGSGRFRGVFDPARAQALLFQSPSLRGSGRFLFYFAHYRLLIVMFQSPSLRGSGRFKKEEKCCQIHSCFNPLHCGAVVASIIALGDADEAMN